MMTIIPSSGNFRNLSLVVFSLISIFGSLCLSGCLSVCLCLYVYSYVVCDEYALKVVYVCVEKEYREKICKTEDFGKKPVLVGR